MPPKRKQGVSSAQNKANKRSKGKGRANRSYRPAQEGRLDPLYYEATGILEEREDQYYIVWKDGPNGEKYEPTWEPKANANQLLIDDWESYKAQGPSQDIEPVAEARVAQVQGSTEGLTFQSAAPAPLRGVGRPRKTLSDQARFQVPKLPTAPREQLRESSIPSTALPLPTAPTSSRQIPRRKSAVLGFSESQTSLTNSEQAPPTPPSVVTDEVTEIEESQHSNAAANRQSESPSSLCKSASDPPSPPQAKLQELGVVQVPEPPSSYKAGAYEKATSSQLLASSQVTVSTPAHDSPQSVEPSLFVPDPNDTSKTTLGDTEASIASTSTADQTQSELADLGSNGPAVVPDSQALHESSSFVVSASASAAQSQYSQQTSSGLTVDDLSLPDIELHPQSLETSGSDQPPYSAQETDPGQPEDTSLCGSGPEDSNTALPSAPLPFFSAACTPELSEQPADKDSPDYPESGVPGTPQTGVVSSRKPRSARATIEKGQLSGSKTNRSGNQDEEHRADDNNRHDEFTAEIPATAGTVAPLITGKDSEATDTSGTAAKPPAERQISDLHSVQRRSPSLAEVVSQSSEQSHYIVSSYSERQFSSGPAPVTGPLGKIGAQDITTIAQSLPGEPQQSSRVSQDESVFRSVEGHIEPQTTLSSTVSTRHQSPKTPSTATSSAKSGSGFPFETQLPHKPDAARTRAAKGQTIFATEHPIAGSSNYSPATVLIEDRQLSDIPAQASSPLQAPPSQPFTFQGNGTSRPNSFSDTLRSPPAKTRQMDPSQELSTPRSRAQALLESLTAMRAESKARLQEKLGQNDGRATPATSDPAGSVAMSISPSERTEQKLSSQAPSGGTTPQADPKQLVNGAQHALMTSINATPVLDVQPASAVPAYLASPSMRGARSPSMVPAIRPLDEATEEEQNTSERYETLIPESRLPSSQFGLDIHHSADRYVTNSAAKQTCQSLQESFIHVVPVAFDARQRDQYRSTLYYHEAEVRQFLSGPQDIMQLSDDEITGMLHHKDPLREKGRQDIDLLLDKLRRVAFHPDLNNLEALTQYNTSPKEQAQWDVDSSVKFRVLRDLFDGLRDHPCHVKIVTPAAEKMPAEHIGAMVCTFLEGSSVSHRNFTGDAKPRFTEPEAKLKVTVVSADDAPTADSCDIATDLIVVMDGHTLPDSDLIQAIHTKSSDDQWPTLVVLVVPSSVEHIERSLPPDLHSEKQILALLRAAYMSHNHAGILPDGEEFTARSGKTIAQYVANRDVAGEWPLGELHPFSNASLQPAVEEAALDLGGLKRSYDSTEDDDTDNDVGKRLRLTIDEEEASQAPTTINPQDIENTPISESLANIDQSVDTTDIAALQERYRSQLEEREQALTGLQWDHEEQKRELVTIRKQLSEATALVVHLQERAAEVQVTKTAVASDRDKLRQACDEANARLLLHGAPEQQEIERYRQAASHAKAEQVKAETRLDVLKRDLDFAREQYQNSSQSASKLATREKELEVELAAARIQASGAVVKLRQMGVEAHTKNLQRENKQLKTRVQSMEATLAQKDEELQRLKEAGRGRVGTRGSSMPRTPRLGSPMKTAEDVYRSVRSRQGSPAAGEIRGRGSQLNPARALGR